MSKCTIGIALSGGVEGAEDLLPRSLGLLAVIFGGVNVGLDVGLVLDFIELEVLELGKR